MKPSTADRVSELAAPKCSTVSDTASASNSGGTSRASLNWSGSSTSNRRHLLLIAGLALHRERDPMVCERLERRFGHQMLPGLKHTSPKPPQQESQCFPLGLAVWKLDDDHNPFYHIRVDFARGTTGTADARPQR